MELKMKPGKKKIFDEGDESSTSSSSEGSSSSSDVKLKVNKSFAKEYQNRKEREELRTIRQRDEDYDSDGSSSEEEDEDGNLLTKDVNLQFLKTMKAIRNKETSVYDPKTRFFDEAEGNDEDADDDSDTKSRKPQRFKDVIRNQILEQMDDEEKKPGSKKDDLSPNNSKLTYDEEQQELRKAFLKGSENADGDKSDDAGDDWMVVKKKGVKLENDAKDEEIQKQFEELQKSSGGKNTAGNFADPRGEVKDGEKFLLDFMKNKKWIDRNDDDDSDDDAKDSDDESDVDRADDFEANYNFRFEKAAEEAATSGATLSVQTYARGQTMNTVRRQDTTRKDKRLAHKDRKATERKAKEEQLKRLKNAKRQEMNHKLSQVKSVLGAVKEEAVDEVALMKMMEGDYDPEKFEKAMQEAYGDDFYQKEDTEWKSDLDVRKSLEEDEDGQAVVGQDDVEGGMYDNYDEDEGEDDDTGNEDEGNDGENDDEDMDLGGEGAEETQLEKNVKTKMQEELYKLDYEDIVAGLPTRFKYRQVEANNYGVSTQEILLARDTTLKQFVSLKKMAPYNEGEEYNAGSRKRRRFRDMLKQELEEDTAKEQPLDDEEAVDKQGEGETEEPKKKKRRRLKKGKKRDKDSTNDEDEKQNTETTIPSETANDELPSKPSDETEEKAKRRRKKKGKKVAASELVANENYVPVKKPSIEALEVADSSNGDLEKAKVEKKKKKRKKKKGAIADLPASRLSSYGL
jgi:protein KRI1